MLHCSKCSFTPRTGLDLEKLCDGYFPNHGVYCTKSGEFMTCYLTGLKSSIMGCVPIFVIAWTEKWDTIDVMLMHRKCECKALGYRISQTEATEF